MSGRELARQFGKSEGYVRERIKDKYEFSLNDIEDFCTLISVQPDVFMARIEADADFRARFTYSTNVVRLHQSGAQDDLDEEALAASDRDYEAEQERQSEDT